MKAPSATIRAQLLALALRPREPEAAGEDPGSRIRDPFASSQPHRRGSARSRRGGGASGRGLRGGGVAGAGLRLRSRPLPRPVRSPAPAPPSGLCNGSGSSGGGAGAGTDGGAGRGAAPRAGPGGRALAVGAALRAAPSGCSPGLALPSCSHAVSAPRGPQGCVWSSCVSGCGSWC